MIVEVDDDKYKILIRKTRGSQVSSRELYEKDFFDALVDDMVFRMENKKTCPICNREVLGVQYSSPYCPYCGSYIVEEIKGLRCRNTFPWDI